MEGSSMFPLLIEQFQVCDDVRPLARFILYHLLLVDTKPTTITVTLQAGAHQSQQLNSHSSADSDRYKKIHSLNGSRNSLLFINRTQ